MKVAILKSLYGKSHIDTQIKERLLAQVIGDQKSDLVEDLKLACKARLPDADIKQEVWNDILNKGTLSILEYLSLFSHFR